ncbi:MAG TPA: NAD-dependent epimerase/dehydratase family protein [Longimicrobiales bacterium]|nr:NAD-dependent epimerase/dehydratase family protein [Longimicrobiales bacterium]
MSTSRRDFLQRTATVAGAAALAGTLPAAASATAASAAGATGSVAAPGTAGRSDAPPAPDRSLRILILGGTGFTGPFQVQYAVARGHHVTVFNRGRRQAELPASVVQLQGDRNEANGLAALEAAVARGERWDVVIDNPTTLPFWVRDAGRVLREATEQYVFISTISVYSDTSRVGMDETTSLAEYRGADPLTETMETFAANQGQLYGPLKAASEREAERWFPGRTTIIRPGLIVGPGDMTGRFTYWPVRMARGGDVLAPGTGHDPVQFIDARDLAEWTVRMVESRTFGTFNATGPAGRLSMAEMLGGIRAAFDGTTPTRLVWAPVDVLAEHRVRGWSDMPVWVAPTPANAGFSAVSIQRALDAGLTFRPLATTARDTVAWFESQPEDVRARVGGAFTAEREAAVVKAVAAGQ